MLFRFYRNDELRKTMANILRNKRGGEIKSEDAFRQQQGLNSLIKTYSHTSMQLRPKIILSGTLQTS